MIGRGSPDSYPVTLCQMIATGLLFNSIAAFHLLHPVNPASYSFF
jgi:hypothetical protein